MENVTGYRVVSGYPKNRSQKEERPPLTFSGFEPGISSYRGQSIFGGLLNLLCTGAPGFDV